MDCSTITANQIKEFRSIYEKFLPKRDKQYSFCSVSPNTPQSPAYMLHFIHLNTHINGKNEQNRDVYKEIDPIIAEAFAVLDKNCITNYDMTSYLVQFQQRNCGFENKPYKDGEHKWRKDNIFGQKYLGYNGYTVEFIIRKDPTVNGGGFECRVPEKSCHPPSFLPASVPVDISSNVVETRSFETKTGDVFLRKGDVEHRVLPADGFGCFDKILVFVKKSK